MKRFLIVGLLVATLVPVLRGQQIGKWRDHFNYTRAIDVDVMGGRVYAAQKNGLFIYDRADNGVERLTKINGLSDIGVTALRAAPDESLLVVGYSNGNIDVIRDRTVYNMPAIKNSDVTGDKGIRHITFRDHIAYLSTGVGIIAFDTEMLEVRDTYSILAETSMPVNQTTIANDTLYAATDEGLYKAAVYGDLTIFSNWSMDLSIPDPFGKVNHLASDHNGLYVNMKEADPPGVYLRRDGESTWQGVRNSPYIDGLRNSPGGVTLNTSYYIILLGEDGVSLDVVIDNYVGSEASLRVKTGVADAEGNLWIADGLKGLVKRTPSGAFDFIHPDGPGSNSVFDLSIHEGRLWVASGNPSHPGTWNNSFDQQGFYKFFEGSWTNFMPEDYPILSDRLFLDVPIAYPDRRNPDKAYVGSWFSGMLVAEDEEILEIYDETNSSLNPRVGYERSDGRAFIAVGGIAQDDDGNVWITNGYADEPLSVWSADGEWHSYALGNALGTNTLVHKMIIDQNGYKWFIRNRGGLVVFDQGETLMDESDDRVRVLTADVGKGDLPVDEVYCLAEDLDGEIWVGTADGVAVFYSPFDIFSDNASDARQILVEQDGIFQYLLETQPVGVIAVDGANRKWVGTFGSGVFLLSEDGTEEIHRFNTGNSPLPSDMVRDIAVDPTTGEVFFATEEGLVSYVSDATQSVAANECNAVYPNPVRETYTGPISISGLIRDSEVRITDARGNLIFSDQSKGGKAIWDGRNINGERVATGVYFALITEPESKSTCVSKILVIK